MSNNRAFTQDPLHVAKKKQQQNAWNLFGKYIDFNFKPKKMKWDDDLVETLLLTCAIANVGNWFGSAENTIDWSELDHCGTVFSIKQAADKLTNIV